MGIQYMRRVIQKKAKFDIMDLNVVQFAPNSFIPALFGHASEDIFVQPHHSDIIYKSYAGDKNFIKFEGDHNSPRPQFYYDSVSMFFYNVLHPPHLSSTSSSKQEKYHNLGDLRAGAGTDESLLYGIITSLRSEGTNAASSSSAPPGNLKSSTAKSVVELLAESVASMSVKEEVDFLIAQANSETEMGGNVSEGSSPQDTNVHNGECCSDSSSNRESWGRCSSLGGESVGSSPTNNPRVSNSKQQKALRALATPLRRIQGKTSAKLKEKKKGLIPTKKSKQRLNLEKGDTLSQRLRVCFLGRGPQHKRHQST